MTPPNPTEQEAELVAAGWTRARGTMWRSPDGGLFRGPHGAWLAMKGAAPAAELSQAIDIMAALKNSLKALNRGR